MRGYTDIRYLFTDSETTCEYAHSEILFTYYIFPKSYTNNFSRSDSVIIEPSEAQTKFRQLKLYQGSTGMVIQITRNESIW